MLKFEKRFFFIFFIVVFLRVLIPSTIELPILQKLELVVNICLLTLGLFSSVFYLNRETRNWLASFVFMLSICIFVSNFIAEDSINQSIIALSKYLLPIVIAISFFEYSARYPYFNKFVHFLFFICLLLFAFAILFGESFMHGGKERLPVYFGTLHDNGYISATVALYGFFMLNLSSRKRTGLIILLIGMYLMMGYKVRTAMLLFVTVLTCYYVRRMPSDAKKFVLGESIVIGTILLTFFLNIENSNTIASDFSSGRISMWGDQIQRFTNSSFLNWFLGFGTKGDIIFATTVWQWEAKDAHNTLLSILVRYGVIGFLFFSMFFTKVCNFFTTNMASTNAIALFLGFFSSLIVSNGLFGRTVPSILYFLLFVVIHDFELSKKKVFR